MRPLLALACVVLLAVPAAAQAPRALNAAIPTAHAARLLDPALAAGATRSRAVRGDSVVADTTDWRAYFPLEVGNRWQYEYNDGQFVSYFGHDIVADTLIKGERYFMLRTCQQNALSGEVTCTDDDPDDVRAYTFLRYDTTFALVVERYEFEGQGNETWWFDVPCALDAPFGGDPLRCGEPYSSQRYFVTGGYGYTVVVGQDTLRDRTYKEFEGEPNIEINGMVAGLGRLFRQILKGSTAVSSLVYARVGGAEVGEEAFGFPSAAEPEATRPAVALSVVPNPARGAASLRLVLPTAGTARVEAADILGRTVRSLDLGPLAAGRHEIPLDLAGLPPGLYFVRLLTEGRPLAVSAFTVVR